MSAGPHAEAAFIRENQSKAERGDPHSALFYLFQEVSKLASPIHSSLLDTNPPNKSLNETSRKNPFLIKKEEEGDGHSFQVSLSSFQRSVSSKMPQNIVKNHVSEESPAGTATTLDETTVECNSPWRVLSLINLHCEKLLHQGDDEVLSSTEYGHTPATLTSAADVAEGRVGKDGVQLTLRSPPLCGRRDVTPSTSNLEDVREDGAGDGYKLHCCMKNAERSWSLQPQTAERRDSVKVELQENNATAALSPQRYRQEMRFSAGQPEQNREWRNHCSTEYYILDEAFCENALEETLISKTCLNSEMTSRSNDECKDPSKPVLTLDHNANVILTTELPRDTQPPHPSTILLSSGSASLIFNTVESSDAPSRQEDVFTTPKPGRNPAPLEGKTPAAAQLKSSSCDLSSASSGPEVRTVKREEIGLSSTCQRRTKTPRKQPHPSRSADIQDPDFQGVTFRMDTELDDTREQCRLLITSKYSKELCQSVRKPRPRTRTSQKSIKTSSSDDETDLANNIKGKICASCCTRKTPMWRDAEDGTPLCNACGIRYKKYRVRCVNCWHIPRKEGNSNSRCLKCGNSARLASAQRKHTT